MSAPSDTLLKALALLASAPELFRTVEDMHEHFTGEPLASLPAQRLPGVVLRWLHCSADLELWQEAFTDRPAPPDTDQVLHLAAQLEELGIEAEDERTCFDCEYRKKCL